MQVRMSSRSLTALGIFDTSRCGMASSEGAQPPQVAFPTVSGLSESPAGASAAAVAS